MIRNTYFIQRENNPHRAEGMSFTYLAKLGAIDDKQLREGQGYFKTLIEHACQQQPIDAPILVVGIAESSIILSALVFQLLQEWGIPAHWVCSSRRPTPGIHFVERHSHAPHHHLPLPGIATPEVWFVEDEVTTGQTVLNLMLQLHTTLNVKRFRLFCLADIRSPEQRQDFEATLAQHQIAFSFDSVLQIPAHSAPIVKTRAINPEETAAYEASQWHFPLQRPALTAQDQVASHPVAGSGSLLVIGEAVDVAVSIVRANPQFAFQHITLSPWRVDNNHIVSRLRIGEKYYLYNYHLLKPPLYLLNDPIDAPLAAEAARLLAEQGFEISNLELALGSAMD